MSKSDCYIQSPSGLITDAVITGPLYAGKYTGSVTVDKSDLTNIKFEVDVKTENQKDVAQQWSFDLKNLPIHMSSHQFVGSNPSLPSELKFFFPATITIDGADFDVLLGQGQYLTTNNWWIGSLHMASVSGVQIGKFGFFTGTFLIQMVKKLHLPTINVVTFDGSYHINITNVVSGS